LSNTHGKTHRVPVTFPITQPDHPASDGTFGPQRFAPVDHVREGKARVQLKRPFLVHLDEFAEVLRLEPAAAKRVVHGEFLVDTHQTVTRRQHLLTERLGQHTRLLFQQLVRRRRRVVAIVVPARPLQTFTGRRRRRVTAILVTLFLGVGSFVVQKVQRRRAGGRGHGDRL